MMGEGEWNDGSENGVMGLGVDFFSDRVRV